MLASVLLNTLALAFYDYSLDKDLSTNEVVDTINTCVTCIFVLEAFAKAVTTKKDDLQWNKILFNGWLHIDLAIIITG